MGQRHRGAGLRGLPGAGQNLVGPENAGFVAIMANFNQERLLPAAQCVAIAELALREAIRYAKEREAFGRPIAGFPASVLQSSRAAQ